MAGLGDEADKVREGGSLVSLHWETLFFTSVASSVCFRQQLRMKLRAHCCPQRHLQSLPYPQVGKS